MRAEALDVAVPVLDGATGAEHVELALTLARAAVLAGRWDTVRDLVERAGRPGDPRSATLLADAAHGAGLLDEALAHALGAVACAERDGDPEQLCRCPGGPRQGATPCRPAERPATCSTGLPRWPRSTGSSMPGSRRCSGRTTLEMLDTENASGLDAARRLARPAELVGQVISIDLLRADSVLVHDGPAAAVPLAQDLLERGTVLELPMPRLAGLSMLALAAAAAGDRLKN